MNRGDGLDKFQESALDSQDKRASHAFGIFQSPALYSSLPLILGISTLISYLPLQSWERSWFITMVVYSSLAVLLPFIAGFLYRKSHASIPILRDTLDVPENQSSTWLAAQFEFVFNNRVAYIIGICLAIAGTVTTEALGLPWSGITRSLAITFFAVLFGFTGFNPYPPFFWSATGVVINIHNLTIRIIIIWFSFWLINSHS